MTIISIPRFLYVLLCRPPECATIRHKLRGVHFRQSFVINAASNVITCSVRSRHSRCWNCRRFTTKISPNLLLWKVRNNSYKNVVEELNVALWNGLNCTEPSSKSERSQKCIGQNLSGIANCLLSCHTAYSDKAILNSLQTVSQYLLKTTPIYFNFRGRLTHFMNRIFDRIALTVRNRKKYV